MDSEGSEIESEREKKSEKKRKRKRDDARDEELREGSATNANGERQDDAVLQRNGAGKENEYEREWEVCGGRE